MLQLATRPRCMLLGNSKTARLSQNHADRMQQTCPKTGMELQEETLGNALKHASGAFAAPLAPPRPLARLLARQSLRKAALADRHHGPASQAGARKYLDFKRYLITSSSIASSHESSQAAHRTMTATLSPDSLRCSPKSAMQRACLFPT